MGIEYGREIPQSERQTPVGLGEALGVPENPTGNGIQSLRAPIAARSADVFTAGAPESPKGVDVEALRPIFRARVDEAFVEAAMADTSLSEGEAASDYVAAGELIRGVPDDTTIRLPERTDFRGIVHTKDPLAYRVLLEEAYRYFYDNLDPELVSAEVERAYAHEMAHATPALAEESLHVILGFKIRVDKENDIVEAGAVTSVSGVTTVGKYREIVSGPDELSDKDRLLLGEQPHDHGHKHGQNLQ